MTGLAAAAAAIAAADGAPEMLTPLLSTTGATGASITTLGNPFGSETLAATDPQAATFSERQIDLGVGPAWDAVRTDAPVLLPGLRDVAPGRWPGALPMLLEIGVETVRTYPMRLGGLPIGTVTIHGTALRSTVRERSATDQPDDDASALVEAVGRRVLQLALHRADASADEAVAGPFSRHDDPAQVLIGAGLAVIGLVVSFINRWQVRRGH